MWRRVSLKNYRSIESAEVELAPFTVVVGPNGSGKSNFVDALVLASEIAYDAGAAIRKRGGISAVRRWGVPDTQETRVRIDLAADKGAFDSRFVRQSFELLPSLETGWRFGSEMLAAFDGGQAGSNLSRKDGQEVGHLETPHLAPRGFIISPLEATTSLALYARQMASRDFQIFSSRRLQLDLATMRTPQPPGESARLKEDGSNISSVLRRLREHDAQAFEFMLLAMRRLIPGLEDIFVEEAGGFLLLQFKQRQAAGIATFAATSMSEGALRALGIIVASCTVSPADFLIVEEPEVAIHPGAAALLFDVLKRASDTASVLVTTHSPELLDAAQDEEILVCSYRNGATRIGSLATEQRKVVRDGLYSLSELARSEPLRIEGEEPEVLEPSDLNP
ncbi:AAA family ATPase [Pyxidicoccus sp. 3LG]